MGMVMVMVGVAVIMVCICSALLRWNEMRYTKKRLPPGTMGWPIFGETTDFLKQGPDFMKTKRARYGNFFKSHVLGCPTIVSMDAELNRYILMNESKGFVAGYPKAMVDILGSSNIAAVHGSNHRLMRGSLLFLISPAMIRDHLLPKIDSFMRRYVSSWDESGVIDIQDKTKHMAFLSSLAQVAETLTKAETEAFTNEFFKLVLGTISIPINLPGSNYRFGTQARKNIDGLLTKLMEERRASGETFNDMLGYLMRKEDNRYPLSDKEIRDQIVTILYSGYETVSTTSMMALKYLHDHPKALEEIRREHFSVRERKGSDEPLDFEDVKSMKFTRAVIFEASRLATIVNGVLRKTTHDMEFNGYFIPKGWRIYVYTRELNYDTSLYQDPFTFNPWRWMDKNLETKNYFLLFGGGIRLCPGKELGIVEISSFLHHFITRYRWEEVGGEKLMVFPRVFAPKGFHARVSAY
ncbi:PREDICTED: cytochrome P450 85A2-like [Tarenaya hassleriana]|uniref:cytochrome P450 85A2-like n=1 Tax=Tarenaya hassleriana TaxID=28532 RepID=UPI00053C38B8|nr:PREDICTED: cytochrome P450 85A2-like [Tarenaya hassleriana]